MSKVICIGRQYGSGGHDIGKTLAERLQIPFHDRSLIELASERSGLSLDVIERGEERKTSQWLYAGMHDTNAMLYNNLPATDITFNTQREIILEAAREGDCIIVGRCSDVILKSTRTQLLNVFICAPFEDRVRRKMELEGWDEKTATANVRRTDKRRKAYYDFNTGFEWGKPENYDLCLNSSAMGIEGIVNLLEKLYKET